MKKLYGRWGEHIHFVDILTRQAHPGPGAPPYHSFEQKMKDAKKYRQEEHIPWTVLIDDLQGTLHQVYGGVADPTYLIDIDGQVAYYDMITGASSLHKAIEKLTAQGGRGIVNNGLGRRPHLLPAITEGWRALERGLPQSFVELMAVIPGLPIPIWLGYQIRPLLAPLTLRAKPLPIYVKALLAVGALSFGVKKVIAHSQQKRIKLLLRSLLPE